MMLDMSGSISVSPPQASSIAPSRRGLVFQRLALLVAGGVFLVLALAVGFRWLWQLPERMTPGVSIKASLMPPVSGNITLEDARDYASTHPEHTRLPVTRSWVRVPGE